MINITGIIIFFPLKDSNKKFNASPGPGDGISRERLSKAVSEVAAQISSKIGTADRCSSYCAERTSYKNNQSGYLTDEENLVEATFSGMLVV